MPDAPGRTAAHWRRLPLEVADAAALLEGSAGLLDGLAEDPCPTLRWYRARRTAIVLGRGQRRLAVRAGPDVDLVRRESGGGAVLLDPELLSLDVAVPAGHPWLDAGDLGAVFTRVGAAWAEALAALGLRGAVVHDGPSTTPRATDARSTLLAAVCYATLGRGEVRVGARKLVGLSQRHRRHGVLVQCGLLRRWGPGALLAALGADPGDAEVTGAAVGLDELLTPAPDDARVIAAVETAFERSVAAPRPCAGGTASGMA